MVYVHFNYFWQTPKSLIINRHQPTRRHISIFQKYYEVPKKRLVYFQKIGKELDMVNKYKPMAQYESADLVYLILCQTSLLLTSSRKSRVIDIEPPVVYKIINTE